MDHRDEIALTNLLTGTFAPVEPAKNYEYLLGKLDGAIEIMASLEAVFGERAK